MKKTLLMLAMAMASSSAFALDDETGQISFYGTIYGGGTCPIEVVAPGASVIPEVSLGNFTKGYFHTPGTATPDKAFALKITPTPACQIVAPHTATVKYTPLHGIVGGDLYGVNGASGVGVAIKDRLKAKIAPNSASIPYDLYVDRPTEMVFYASYESYADAAVITDGVAQAEVAFTVDMP